MSNTGIIYGVNGPVIYLKGDSGFKISEMVYVGPEHLVGEIIGLKKGMTTVQVFEETTGLKPGDTVTGTGDAISVLLGPGIIHNIFDGIQRPLEEIAKASGKYISRGVSVDSLDTEKKWNTHIIVKEGDVVQVDQQIMILEAMKMEIDITAPVSGVITKILVNNAQAVDEGQTLAIIG